MHKATVLFLVLFGVTALNAYVVTRPILIPPEQEVSILPVVPNLPIQTFPSFEDDVPSEGDSIIGTLPIEIPDGGLVIGHLPAPYDPCAPAVDEVVPIEPEVENPTLEISPLPIIPELPVVPIEPEVEYPTVEISPLPIIPQIPEIPTEPEVEYPTVEIAPLPIIPQIPEGGLVPEILPAPIEPEQELPIFEILPIPTEDEEGESDAIYLPDPEAPLGEENEEGVLVIPNGPVAETLPIVLDEEPGVPDVQYLPEVPPQIQVLPIYNRPPRL